MWSSKFRTNHREVDFYLHTFSRSNCIMRPSSKWCWPEFKANPVQRKSDLIFTQVKSKCDHTKVVPVRATPFEMLEKTSFWIPKRHFSIHQEGVHTACAVVGSYWCFPGRSSLRVNSIENVGLCVRQQWLWSTASHSAESHCVFFSITKSITACTECRSLKKVNVSFSNRKISLSL